MDQTPGGSRPMTRGLSKTIIQAEKLRKQKKRLEPYYRNAVNGVQGRYGGVPVNQNLGKIKVESEYASVKVEDDDHLIIPDDALNGQVFNSDAENGDLFPIETLEQKVVAVSSEMDCEEGNPRRSDGKSSFNPPRTSDCTESNEANVINVTTPIFGDTSCDEPPVVVRQEDDKSNFYSSQDPKCTDSNEGNLANQNTMNFVIDCLEPGHQGEHWNETFNGNFAHTSSNNGQVECPCQCSKEILILQKEVFELKDSIQQKDQQYLNIIQRLTRAEELLTRLKSKPTADASTLCDLMPNMPDKMPTEDGGCSSNSDVNFECETDGLNIHEDTRNEAEISEKCDRSFYEFEALEPLLKHGDVVKKDTGCGCTIDIYIHITKDILCQDWFDKVNNCPQMYSDCSRRPLRTLGCLWVNEDGAYNDAMFLTARNSVTSLLQKIGKCIRYFYYKPSSDNSQHPSLWYKNCFREWINLMPNLQLLSVERELRITKEDPNLHDELNDVICLHPLKKLDKLWQFSCLGIYGAVVQSVLSATSKISSFEAEHICFHTPTNLSSVRYLSLVVRESDFSDQYFKSLQAPVRTLIIDYTGRGRLQLSDIVATTKQFYETLERLHVNVLLNSCEYIGSHQFRLRNLKYLCFWFCSNDKVLSSDRHDQKCSYEYFINLVSALKSLEELKLYNVYIDNINWKAHDKNRRSNNPIEESADIFLREQLNKRLTSKLWIQLPRLNEVWIRLSPSIYLRRPNSCLKYNKTNFFYPRPAIIETIKT